MPVITRNLCIVSVNVSYCYIMLYNVRGWKRGPFRTQIVDSPAVHIYTGKGHKLDNMSNRLHQLTSCSNILCCYVSASNARWCCALQHYAVKTIENIGSQAGQWAQRFASSEVVSYLVTIWQGSKNDNVRSTAASTLSRLVRHSPTLLGPTLEKYSLKPVILGMPERLLRCVSTALW